MSIPRNKVLTDDGLLIPDMLAVRELEDALSEKTRIIIAAGSGVIGDICRYVCMKKGLTQLTVASAPSMDGYASGVAAMIFDGKRISFPAKPPKWIVGDSEVLAAAPREMLVSGIGDILGKCSCLNDWRLSNAVTGEALCEDIYALTLSQYEKCVRNIDKIMQGDEEAVTILFEALCAVGIAMSLCGSSRPASGCEHHISHWFEVTGLGDGTQYLRHGIDVAYSAVITARLREQTVAAPVKLEGNPKKEQILQILASCPSSAELEGYLERIGLHMADFFALYGEERVQRAVREARFIRDRYTFLTLMEY